MINKDLVSFSIDLSVINDSLKFQFIDIEKKLHSKIKKAIIGWKEEPFLLFLQNYNIGIHNISLKEYEKIYQKRLMIYSKLLNAYTVKKENDLLLISFNNILHNEEYSFIKKLNHIYKKKNDLEECLISDIKDVITVFKKNVYSENYIYLFNKNSKKLPQNLNKWTFLAKNIKLHV